MKEKNFADNELTDVKDNEMTEKKGKLAELVEMLKGDRSTRQMSSDTGVAASYINMICKKNYIPSAAILTKLTAPESNPKNGITLEDVMVAAGYQADYVKEAYKNAAEEAVENGIEGEKFAEFNKTRIQEISDYEKKATATIYNVLVDLEIPFSKSKDVAGKSGYKPDMSIDISMGEISKWYFDFKYIGAALGNSSGRRYVNIRHILGQLIFIEPNPSRKVSIVINSEETFKSMKEYRDKLAYRGELSVILVDVENLSVKGEEYLAHYYDNDKSSEFRITGKQGD